MACSKPILVVLALLGALQLGACDRKPVVAGVFRFESTGMAGGPQSGAGSSAMAGTEASMAGSTGANCAPELWYGVAQIVSNLDCKVLFFEEGHLLAYLWTFPNLRLSTAGESRGQATCDRAYWRQTIEDGDMYIVACREWCDHIRLKILEENDRISACVNAMQAGMGMP